MKQRYNDLSDMPAIYELAVEDCFAGKYRRNDILMHIEKYCGIPRHEILLEELNRKNNQATGVKREAITGCALALEEMVNEILEDEEPYLDPVKIRRRPDGMTGKIRDIALLSIPHQLIEHTVYLLLKPFFKQKLYPTQHASIPGRGQTRLKNQVHRYLRSTKLGVVYARKTDMVQAYQSIQYETVIEMIRKDIPDAKDVLKLLAFLGRHAPGGHLIIGGYIDAWLFNYVMSKVMAEGYKCGTYRRGKFRRAAIRIVTFMDDTLILTSSIKGLKQSIQTMKDFAQKTFHMVMKTTTGVIQFLAMDKEKERDHAISKAHRGCPCIDMAGFKISRSHISIGRRVFLRTRRQLLRAWEELQTTGTIQIQRARKLISYNGFIKQADTDYLR